MNYYSSEATLVGTSSNAVKQLLPDRVFTQIPRTREIQFDRQIPRRRNFPRLSAPFKTAALVLAVAASSHAALNNVLLTPGTDIGSVVDSQPGNTTFIFSAGYYRLQQLHPKSGDSFVGEPGAILSGAQLLTSFSQEGKYWVVYGQTQQGQVHGVCDAQHPGCIYPEDLFFDDQPLQHVTSLSAVTTGAWFFDYPNHKIYFLDNPNGHKVETSVTSSAFYSCNANGVTVQGLIVEKYANPAQIGVNEECMGTNWSFLHNEVRLNHGTGINAPPGSQLLSNFVHHNGQKGLGGGGANTLIEGNEVSFNNWAGFNTGWEAGGAKFAGTTGLIVRANYVHDNNGVGLWTDIDNINVLYENNMFTNNANGGIQHEISYSAVIRNNYFQNNGSAGCTWLWGASIIIQNSQNVEAYNNVLDSSPDQTACGNGIAVINQNRGTGAYGPYNAINNYIHDNVVIARGPGGSGIVADYNGAYIMASGNNRFENNTYHLNPSYGSRWWAGSPGDWTSFQKAGFEGSGRTDTQIPN